MDYLQIVKDEFKIAWLTYSCNRISLRYSPSTLHIAKILENLLLLFGVSLVEIDQLRMDATDNF